MPNMLGEIVEQTLRAFPELRIVGGPPFHDGPVAAARQAQADLLVLCEGDPALVPITELEGLAVFSLAADGRKGALLTLHRRRLVLDRAGLSDLPRLIARHGGPG